MDRYTLRLTGELLPGASRPKAVSALATLLRLTAPQAQAALNGRPSRVQGTLTHERAEAIRHRLEHAGIACHVDRTPDPPPQRTAPRKSRLRAAAPEMRCPKCGHRQPPGEICAACGVVFAKLEQAKQRVAAQPAEAPALREDRAFSYPLANRILLLIFLSAIAVALWSHWRKDQLPPPDFYDLTRLEEPRQTRTSAKPFPVEANDITYSIEPLFDYELDGVVVSLHDSDAFIDVYHFQDWKDFINIRDLCVVWGDNVATGVFRDMRYRNATWTCWISANDAEAARRFEWDQLSNNHLLAHEAHLYDAIKSAEVGDQIRLRGKLATYSHDGGFRRGTSTTRKDTGDGACETIYVEDFQVVRKSNPGWRLTYRISTIVIAISFIGLAIIFFVAPYRPRR